MFYLEVHHLSPSVSPGWLIQTGCHWESTDSSPCLVCHGRWDLGFSHKVTAITAKEETKTWWLLQLLFRTGVHLLNSNTSSTSKLKLLWLYTKQNIWQGEIFIEAPSLPVLFVFTKHLSTFSFFLCLYFCSPAVFICPRLHISFPVSLCLFMFVF